MIKYLLLAFLICASFSVKSQDIEVTFLSTWTYPQSGCDIGGSADQIRMNVKNNGPGGTLGNYVYLKYQINGGVIETDSLPNIGAGLTWQFTFTNAFVDLSACDDTFNILTWVEFVLDGDQTNDTISYQFINSCTIIPGDITGGTTVCQSGNSGTLVHGNYTNGWVADWEYYNAISGGWAAASNYNATFNYSNVQYETYYRVIRTSAYCPNDTSLTDTIYVDSISIAGVTSGSDVVCTGTNMGYIVATGFYGNIDDWEYDNGGGWTSMGGSDSVQYLNLTATTSYRYFVTNGVCPQVMSDTGFVVVNALTVAGTLLQDDTLCSGPNSDTLFLVGNIGTINDWEMDDGSGFISLGGVTDSMLIISNMTGDADFRVVVQSGVCASANSNTITMIIQAAPNVTVGPDVTIMIGDSTQLMGSGGAAWVWVPGATLSDSSLQDPWASPIVTTAYIYYAMSTNGCLNWDTTVVSLIPPVPPIDSVMITNIITANGDGINDTWNITDANLLIGTQVKIWNVYGQELYASDSYMNDWSGKYKGKSLPNGAYFYWVKLGVYENEYKGTITIIGDE